MASIFDDPTPAPAPSKGGSIFDDPTPAQPATPSAPAGQDLGTTALWNKPSDVSWPAYMAAHVGHAFAPLGGIADPQRDINEGLMVGQGVTGGLSNLIPGVGAATEKAEQSVPLQDRLGLEGAGYMLGPGKLGMAKSIGKELGAYMPGWLARAGGSSAEGAAANYVSSLARTGDPSQAEKSAGWGGVLGGVLSPVSEGLGSISDWVASKLPSWKTPPVPEVGSPRSSTAGVSTPPTGMYAQKEAEYSPLGGIYFDGHGAAMTKAEDAIRQQINQAGRPTVNQNVTPPDVQKILTDNGMGQDKWGNLLNPEVTGLELQKASQALRENGSFEAHRYADQLDKMMATETPVRTGPAVPPPGFKIQNLPPTGSGTLTRGDIEYDYNNGQFTGSGPRTGAAWDAKEAGDVWHKRINDMTRLQPDTGDFPSLGAVKQTLQWNAPSAGQPPTPAYNELLDLKNAMGSTGKWEYYARHSIAPSVLGAASAADEYLDPEDKMPWIRYPLHSVAALSTYPLVHGIVKGFPGAPSPTPTGQLNRALYTIGTGNALARPNTTPAISDALRALIFGGRPGQ